MKPRIIATSIVTFLTLFCRVQELRGQGDEIRFVDVSKAAGLVMQHRSKHPNKEIAANRPNFTDVYASGYFWNPQDVAFLDANGDGNLDIFLLNNPQSRWSRLWLGDGKGGFRELDSSTFQMTWGETPKRNAAMPICSYILPYDFRGQGAQDILLTSADVYYHGLRLRCLMTKPAQKEASPLLKVFGTSYWAEGGTALLSDVDGDGIVDFFLGPDKRGLKGGGNVLRCGTFPAYERSAARGEGESAQTRSQLRFEVEPERTAVQLPVGDHAIAADFHGEGHVDLLGRGPKGGHLLRNLGKRRFTAVTNAAGLSDLPARGPVAVADFNNDGLLDIVCCGAGGMRLYLNLGGGKFKDATAGSGLLGAGKNQLPLTSGTATVADFNNDGLPDLLVCDGAVNRLYMNLGGGEFKDVTKESGLNENVMPESSNAAGDFDNDGRVDALVVTPDRGPALYRNVSQNANKWLKVKLLGPRGNPEAAGAQVTIYQAGKLGDRKAILGYQELIIATEFKIPRPLHFGLGRHQQADIRVVFPGGKVVEEKGVAGNHTTTITEDAAQLPQR